MLTLTWLALLASATSDRISGLSAPTRLYTHGDGGFPCIRIPATALQPDGSLLAIAAGRCFTGDSCFPLSERTAAPTNRESAQFTTMISRKSMDSGLTWGSLSTVVAAKGNGSQCLVSDPTVIVDTVHNRTIVMYTDPLGTAMSVFSDDFGETWANDPIPVPFGPGGGSHMAPATGIQLSSSHPTAPGRLLTVAIVKSSCGMDRVIRSDNGGKEWQVSTTNITDCGEAQLAESVGGAIVLNCRNPKGIEKGLLRGRSVSYDGGVTWTPMEVQASTPGTSCMGSLLAHPTNRSVMYFSHPTNLTQRRAGAVYRSDDGGLTWSKPFPVGDESVQFAYSSLSYIPARPGTGSPATDRLGLTYETWAEGCESYAPACAINFMTLPTTW